jgi:folylpolyglutamate synthase
LNIVHVAGTKGKGSTCAYVDSILRAHRETHGVPRKIGLYTSPHLIDVRERIRINTISLSKELFTKYFWEVWDALEHCAVSENRDPLHKPVYFRFLTLMSFHVFLTEEVDVAIYEVGVGGEYDSTNVVENPIVTGITALGIDHVRVLGEKISQIAWHKAGILKPGCPAFTVTQEAEAMAVIEKRAREKNVNIVQVDLNPALNAIHITPDADFQRSNASIAVELAKTALAKFDKDFNPRNDSLTPEFVRGLETVVWRGRCELKFEEGRAWYLDGAHTVDSIRVAAAWFGSESRRRYGFFSSVGTSLTLEFQKTRTTHTHLQSTSSVGSVCFSKSLVPLRVRRV